MNSLRAALMAQAAGLIWAVDETFFMGIKAQIEHGELFTSNGVLKPGEDTDSVQAAAIHPATERATAKREGTVLVVPVSGVISPRMSLFDYLFNGGTTNPAAVAAAVEQGVNDPSIKTVIVTYDTPGGNTMQVTEAAQRMLAVRGKGTPIISQVVGVCASAGYWMASTGDEISATPSGLVGGVGAFQTHDDLSGMYAQEGVNRTFQQAGAFKTEAMDTAPLSDEAVAHRLANVEAVMTQFAADVAKGRNVTPAVVRGEEYGQGRAYLSPLALKRGMVDRVRAFADTLSAYGAQLDPIMSDRRGRTMALSDAAAHARLRGID
ncbi:protease IV [Caulobacter phage TMCBR2]|uniref:Protease IV n=1 Tax=Caulobacter phage TMCBR2 TaxID=3025404 RepID=A0AAE9YAI1_9CAUD|nr:protease IV [Caulobacter phage TMCBR2]WDS38253.1 protease IV [Caulobacter phage TMCBR3]